MGGWKSVHGFGLVSSFVKGMKIGLWKEVMGRVGVGPDKFWELGWIVWLCYMLYI